MLIASIPQLAPVNTRRMLITSQVNRSVSQWSMYTECSEKYRLIKIEKRPSKPAGWTVRGIAVHSALEAWEKSDRDIDALEYLHEVSWPEALARCVGDYPDVDKWLRTPGTKSVERDIELRRLESPSHVRTYIDRALAEKNEWQVWRLPDGTPAVEVPIEIILDTEPETHVFGYVDMVIQWDTGELTIKDVKSGKMDKCDYRQLGTYKVGINEKYGQNIKYGAYWTTKLDRDLGMKDLNIYSRKYLTTMFGTLNIGIEKQVYLPSPDVDKCEKFCGVKDFCREFNA